jgi:flagellar biosynthesis/type III secretory pathway chaperone
MTTPAASDNQSTLEAALLDVHTTLTDLLVAADEQYAAVAARDHERLESVTRQQERLSVRLAQAEARRLEILAGVSLTEAVASPRLEGLRQSIAAAVSELKRRQAQTASLLEQSIELAAQTVNFLHRLVTTPSPVYGARGQAALTQSVLVDGRA